MRLSALILSLLILAGSLLGCDRLPGAAPEEPLPTPTPILPNDPEIQAAVAYGLVPAELQGAFGSAITYKEFCLLLDTMISIARPSKLTDWTSRSTTYRTAPDTMSRMEGMLVFLYAAEAAGLDTIGHENSIPLEDLMPEGMDFWAGATLDYPLLPNIGELYQNETLLASPQYSWRCQYPYSNNAVWFAEYCSYGNGKTYFDYDENYSFRLGDTLTRGDAVRAIVRLYETASYAVYASAKDLKHGVTPESFAYAGSMPEVHYYRLPDWRGHALRGRTETVSSAMGIRYSESEIAALASYGFNFVRVPLDFSLLFETTEMESVNVAYLSGLDQLINWGAKYGVHICLGLTDMPGFTSNGDSSDDTLFSDQATRMLFYRFWLFLAEYYHDVPAKLLSFHLLHAPHAETGATLSNTEYSEFMTPLIKSVINITPDRLMFTDMLGADVDTLVHGLKDAPIVQAAHLDFMNDGTDTWPSYTINGFMHRDKGTLTLKGNFPAGTEITFSFSRAHRDSTLRLRAGRNTLADHDLGGEDVGEGQCIAINEPETENEWRSYSGRTWSVTLERDRTELRVEQTGDGRWYAVDHITIELPHAHLTLSANNQTIRNEAIPVLTITPEGSITAEDPNTLLRMDAALLYEKLSAYQSHTAQSGQAIMIQGFGFNTTIETHTALAAAEDLLTALDTTGIPWCCSAGDYGVLVHENEVQMNALRGDRLLLRNDTSYEDAGDGWLAFTEMLAVYQRHMR